MKKYRFFKNPSLVTQNKDFFFFSIFQHILHTFSLEVCVAQYKMMTFQQEISKMAEAA